MNKRLKLFVYPIIGLVALTVCLLGVLVYFHLHGSHPNDEAYMAVAELLLVLVIAIEGFVALWEFAHNQQSTRAAANAAIFSLYQMYLTVDYHENVRSRAWFCLSQARTDSAYRMNLLAHLVGATGSDTTRGLYERKRRGQVQSGDKEAWDFHYDYHRVHDILGFFTTLSLSQADAKVIQLCGFFYDSWRPPLRRILEDMKDFVKTGPDEEDLKGLMLRRWEALNQTLNTLDELFKLTSVDWTKDPSSKNEDANDKSIASTALR